MKLTIAYIESSFNKYNALYFNGVLKRPSFKITNSKCRLGTLATRVSPFGTKTHTLSVSKYYDRTEKQYDNTIIHEMIHLYISQMNIIDNGSHGRVFKQHCARINKYGWNLSRTTDASDWKLSEEAQKQEKRRMANASYNVIVYKESAHSQFILRVSNGNELRYMEHLKKCGYEAKLFKTNDVVFEKLPCCRNRIRGRRLYGHELEYKKYMI